MHFESRIINCMYMPLTLYIPHQSFVIVIANRIFTSVNRILPFELESAPWGVARALFEDELEQQLFRSFRSSQWILGADPEPR